MNNDNMSGEASNNLDKGAYPFPQERTIQANQPAKDKSKIALLSVIAVLLAVVAYLSLTIINEDKSDVVADDLPKATVTTTPTITIVNDTTSTPIVTATNAMVGDTAKVTPTPLAKKDLISQILKYAFSYPVSWTLKETQGYPMDDNPLTPYTSEEGYMRSGDNKIEFLWVVGSDYSDLGEPGASILVKGKRVPLQVISGSTSTVYRFNGEDTILGIDIPDISRVSFSYTVDKSLNQDEALNSLIDILSSLRVK